MAIVQYQVMYRYVHPITAKAVTNLTDEIYDESRRFIKDYLPTEALQQTKDMMEETDARNPKFDMMFCYSGPIPINEYVERPIETATGKVVENKLEYVDLAILSESFVRCKGECWFTSSTHASLPSALKSADPLVRNLGRENVKVVKIVPLDIEVGLE